MTDDIEVLQLDDEELVNQLADEARGWYQERPLLARLLMTAARRLEAFYEQAYK